MANAPRGQNCDAEVGEAEADGDNFKPDTAAAADTIRLQLTVRELLL
ncbi:hypothetical protein [Arthrobacter sp. NPDC056727]